MKILVHILAAGMLLSAVATAWGEAPQLRHVLDIHAKCGEARALGAVNGGKRAMIPITGGYTEGDVNAVILPGGADYQMIDTVSGRSELNAIYTIITADSVMINVENKGIVSGNRGEYFTTVPSFEAPVNSEYNWLNDRIFVCKPIGFSDGAVHLRVWMVE